MAVLVVVAIGQGSGGCRVRVVCECRVGRERLLVRYYRAEGRRDAVEDWREGWRWPVRMGAHPGASVSVPLVP